LGDEDRLAVGNAVFQGAVTPQEGVAVGGEELLGLGVFTDPAEGEAQGGVLGEVGQEQVLVADVEGHVVLHVGETEQGVVEDRGQGRGGGVDGGGDPVEEGGLGLLGALAAQEYGVVGLGTGTRGQVDGGQEGRGQALQGGTVEGDPVLGHGHYGPDERGVEGDGVGGELLVEGGTGGVLGHDVGGAGGDGQDGVVGVFAVVGQDLLEGGQALQVLVIVPVDPLDRTDVLEGTLGPHL
jgi:hypothetical protein